MIKKLNILVCLIFILLLGCKIEEKPENEVLLMPKETLTNVKILIDYDNNEFDPNLKTGWGFSCVIKFDDKNILFDTGADSPTLLANMGSMGINPKEIDTVVLSHIHGDHVGGLSGFLEKNSDVKIYLPESFPDSFKDEIRSKGSQVFDVHKPTKVCEGIYTTGEIGTWIKEHALILNTDKGLVVITGCAHPGIVNIVKKSKDSLNKKVYLVLGGFHLGGESTTEIKSIIKDFKDLGVEKVAPCHCTGDIAISMFKEEYKDNFIRNGVGNIIKI